MYTSQGEAHICLWWWNHHITKTPKLIVGVLLGRLANHTINRQPIARHFTGLLIRLAADPRRLLASSQKIGQANSVRRLQMKNYPNRKVATQSTFEGFWLKFWWKKEVVLERGSNLFKQNPLRLLSQRKCFTQSFHQKFHRILAIKMLFKERKLRYFSGCQKFWVKSRP